MRYWPELFFRGQMGYDLDVKTQTKEAQGMSREEIRTLIGARPLKVKRSFAGVRGRVKHAAEASPQSVTLSDAVAQVLRFSNAASKRS